MLKRLLSLPTLVPTVLEDEEENTFQKEVHALCVDRNFPSPVNDEDNEVDCLEWWGKISDRYSVLFKVVCAVLSIFHGPRVESTFSVMNNVIYQNSGRMNMEIYGAIQDIKYALKTRKPCEENQSVKVFSHSDRRYSPVDPKISICMRHSYLKLRQKRSELNEKEKNRKEHFEITKTDQTAAKEMKENSATLAAQGRTEHQKIIDQAYKPKKPYLDSSSSVVASSTSAPVYCSTINDIVPSWDSVSSEGINAPKKSKNTGSADDVNVNVNTGTPKKKKNSKSAKVQNSGSYPSRETNATVSTSPVSSKKRKNIYSVPIDSADDVNVNTGTPKKKRNTKSAKVQNTLMAFFNK